MDPREFRRLAMKLVAVPKAAELRAAVGRAYYAAYHVTVAFVEGMGFSVAKLGAGHKQVQDYLWNSGDAEAMQIASKLGSLFSRRVDADYRLNKPAIENQQTAVSLVAEADDLIKALDAICVDAGRVQAMTAAIQAWLGGTP